MASFREGGRGEGATEAPCFEVASFREGGRGEGATEAPCFEVASFREGGLGEGATEVPCKLVPAICFSFESDHWSKIMPWLANHSLEKLSGKSGECYWLTVIPIQGAIFVETL